MNILRNGNKTTRIDEHKTEEIRYRFVNRTPDGYWMFELEYYEHFFGIHEDTHKVIGSCTIEFDRTMDLDKIRHMYENPFEFWDEIMSNKEVNMDA